MDHATLTNGLLLRYCAVRQTDRQTVATVDERTTEQMSTSYITITCTSDSGGYREDLR